MFGREKVSPEERALRQAAKADKNTITSYKSERGWAWRCWCDGVERRLITNETEEGARHSLDDWQKKHVEADHRGGTHSYVIVMDDSPEAAALLAERHARKR
jgi:hypothetical protein